MLLSWSLIILSVGLVVAVRSLALPWWADFLLGLCGGVLLAWGCALVLCHQATVVLRWTQKEDEAAGSRGNTTAHRNGKKSNAERHGV